MEEFIDVCSVTANFLMSHPRAAYPEIEQKAGRPYSCLMLRCCEEFVVAIPFRSHIKHDNVYKFHNSQRSMANLSGLDYSKCLIIKNIEDFLDSPAVVDNDEYVETIQNLELSIIKKQTPRFEVPAFIMLFCMVDTYVTFPIIGTSHRMPRIFRADSFQPFFRTFSHSSAVLRAAAHSSNETRWGI